MATTLQSESTEIVSPLMNDLVPESSSPKTRTKVGRRMGLGALLFVLIAATIIASVEYANAHSAFVRERRLRHKTQSSLVDTSSQLTTVTQARDSLQKQVNDLNTTLTGVRGSLKQVQDQVNLQGGQVFILKSCLRGVIQALLDVAPPNPDYQSAGNALSLVSDSCHQAEQLLSPGSNAQASVHIDSITPDPVAQGQLATLNAVASPNASCNLQVVYSSGHVGQAPGLGGASADDRGNVTWTWKIGSQAALGGATATVSCGSSTDAASFQVVAGG